MRTDAVDAWPEPACGVIVGTEDSPEYLPVSEVADRSRETFRVDEAAARRLVDRHGALLGFVISHPAGGDGPAEPLLFTPSAAEMVAQALLAVPFGVVVCERSRSFKPWWFGDQCPTSKLIGRPFRHGVTDCYSFVRDWARLERKIILPDFPRDWNWWMKGMDLYRMGFYQAGARSIDPAKAAPGDVILLKVRSEVPNHAVVVLADGWIAHHFGSVVPYDPRAVSHVQPPARWVRTLATEALRWHEDID